MPTPNERLPVAVEGKARFPYDTVSPRRLAAGALAYCSSEESPSQAAQSPTEDLAVTKVSSVTSLPDVAHHSSGRGLFSDERETRPIKLRLDNILEKTFNHRTPALVSQFTSEGSGVTVNVDETDSNDSRRTWVNAMMGNNRRLQSLCHDLIESRWWKAFFMAVTIYVLFASDVDSVFGTKRSKLVQSMIMTVIIFLFLLEILLQIIARRDYIFRAFFWLDVVALVSLVPDTSIFQDLFASTSFVSEPSSRLSRLVRIVSRSSKVTRLNRLTRMVRVATLLPRLTNAFKQFASNPDDAALRILEKKLLRIFTFLDESMAGEVSFYQTEMCLKSLVSHKPANFAPLSSVSRTSSVRTMASTATHETFSPHRISSTSVASGNTPGGRSRASSAPPSGERPSLESGESSHWQDVTPSPKSQPGRSGRRSGTQKTRFDVAETVDDKHLSPGTFHSSPALSRGHSRRQSELSVLSSASDADGRDIKMDFDEFKEFILEDEWVRNLLINACRRETSQTESVSSMGWKHVEDVGIKVAFCVLVMLLVLSLVSPSGEDQSSQLAFELLDAQAASISRTWNSTALPLVLEEQVVLWMQGLQKSSARGQLVYLDLAHRTVCDELTDAGPLCPETFSQSLKWPQRISLQDIDQKQSSSSFRKEDLVLMRLPDLSSVDLSEDELNRQTNSVALIYNRYISEEQSRSSMWTTVTVLAIIMLGIVTFTKDLSRLSTFLLQPLRDLADEMQTIAQFQMAGFDQKKPDFSLGVAEVRLIQEIFSKTKTAIRSWGKYVPWPVVQLLLAAGVDAEEGVSDIQVTMFFSDIASFTTIVEKLPPEKSLLLLSRYFNDMSQVIDEHGGIVIEFIGDAILSVFGAPIKNNYHAEACVRATLKMLRALEKINIWSSQNSLPKVSIRCGVHTGRVLIGNMGFHSRMKYGIIGEDASLPPRLEEMNKNYGTNMLMSDDTYESLPPNLFIVRPIDWVYLRPGRPAECVYEVMARSHTSGKTHKLDPPAQMYTKALELYKKRRFEKAYDWFAETNILLKETQRIEEDTPCLLMMKRCLHYLEYPPDEGWDGVWDQANEH